MLLIKSDNLTVESDGRLLTSEEVRAVGEAERLLEAAKAEAARIRATAQEEVEKARQEGYQKGLDDGRSEIIEQKIRMVERSIGYLEQLEGRVVDVVVASLQKCVGQLDARDLITRIIDQAMASIVRTQRQMTIKVSPGNLETVQAALASLHEKYPSVTSLTAAADEHLAPTDCILETDAGSVDASLSVQLAAIERAFRQCFAH